MEGFSDLRIAHIIRDEKFPDTAYDVFEKVAPSCSDYYLPDKSKRIKHLKSILPIRVSKFSFLSSKFIKKLQSYDVVILHGLNAFNLELVARCGCRVDFLWVGMGFDYYDLIYKDSEDMLMPRTRSIVGAMNPKKKSCVKELKRFLRYIVYKGGRNKKKTIKNIKWFAPVLESEYEMVRKMYHGESFPMYLDWNYGISAKSFDGLKKYTAPNGNNILIGNSATPTNNHSDVFELMNAHLDDKNVEIIVPLSYGDERYREIIVEEGRRYFGKKFKPLIDFLEFSDYIDIISTCSVVVMNHKRQQAGANIASALYMGARVFLNEENPFFEYYKKRGVFINSTSDITHNPGILHSMLSGSERNTNREILMGMRGWEQIERKTTQLLASVLKSCDG
ncbi:MAG: TDP-N-acetylfucosamine:lipid II N-acetylfucosaminyltransferase [Alcanivorax sp.]|nr:TDP-N-acetylfucosamine:lipid II N-acetylfucosaminyltransferase [Alcanivorax sp.]